MKGERNFSIERMKITGRCECERGEKRKEKVNGKGEGLRVFERKGETRGRRREERSADFRVVYPM